MEKINQALTNKETLFMSGILRRLTPGFLPLEIFSQIARLTVLSTVEIIAMKKSGKEYKVFLLQRPENDRWWPGMWHIPGSVICPTDRKGTYEDPLTRIRSEEFEDVPFITAPTFFRNHFRQEARGAMNAIQYWALLKEKPKTGKLFSVNGLPANIVPEHLDTIKTAYKVACPS